MAFEVEYTPEPDIPSEHMIAWCNVCKGYEIVSNLDFTEYNDETWIKEGPVTYDEWEQIEKRYGSYTEWVEKEKPSL